MVAKKKAKKKATQREFKNAPKRDVIGKAAIKYLGARSALEDAKTDLDNAKANLIKLMREKRRASIRVEGVIISTRRTEAQDVIKVKKAKD